MRTDILECKEQILNWIEQHQSKAFMCKELKCKPETLNRYLQIMNIYYKGNQAGKDLKKSRRNDYMDLETYLKESQDIQTNKIRIKLIRDGYKEVKCENCGLTSWLGQEIPLEVHHKDGNRHNNVIENFELLCPNCHALTNSYRGKNSAKK